MLAKRLTTAPRALLDPDAAEWATAPEEALALGGTPAADQVSRYVRSAWKDRAIGAVKEVRVRAAHDGESVFFRLEWQDAAEDRAHVEGSFPDAAALLFPLDGEAPISMGSTDHPVNAWYWRPDLEETPQNLTARGRGSVKKDRDAGILARSARKDGVWKLVLARALRSAAGGVAVDLLPGAKTSIAVAVWDGGAGERAGLKAFSQSWRELSVET